MVATVVPRKRLALPRSKASIRKTVATKYAKRKAREAEAKQQRKVEREAAILAKATAAPKPTPVSCQHPKARAYGCCQLPSIGEFTIPADYEPIVRHANQHPIPRPTARLCVQHSYIVQAYAEGIDNPADFKHKSQCPVCRHPRAVQVVGWWLNWQLSATQASQELGVTVSSFKHHCDYYDLDEKRSKKDKTRKALMRIAEEGISGSKPTVKDALAAMAQMYKEGGGAENVNIRGQLVVASLDIAEMGDEELAAQMEETARALRERARQQKQLPG